MLNRGHSLAFVIWLRWSRRTFLYLRAAPKHPVFCCFTTNSHKKTTPHCANRRWYTANGPRLPADCRQLAATFSHHPGPS